MIRCVLKALIVLRLTGKFGLKIKDRFGVDAELSQIVKR
jgi:hypothetical protein